MRGIVKYFNDGYGFIGMDGEEADLFVHWKSIIPKKKGEFVKLLKGQIVEFDIEIPEDGRKRAKNVVVVEEPSQNNEFSRYDQPKKFSKDDHSSKN